MCLFPVTFLYVKQSKHSTLSLCMYNCENSLILFINTWRQANFVYNFQHIKSLRNGNRKPTKRNKLLSNKHHSEFFVPSRSSLGSSEGSERNTNGALTPPGPVFMLPRFVNSTDPKQRSNQTLATFSSWVLWLDYFHQMQSTQQGCTRGAGIAAGGTKLQKAFSACLTSGSREQNRKQRHWTLTSLSASLLVSPNLSRFEGLPTSNIPTARRALLSKHPSKRARHWWGTNNKLCSWGAESLLEAGTWARWGVSNFLYMFALY